MPREGHRMTAAHPKGRNVREGAFRLALVTGQLVPGCMMKRTCGADLLAGNAFASPRCQRSKSPDHLCRSNPRSRFGGTSLRLRQSQQEHGRPCVEATLPTARGDGVAAERPWPHRAITRRARAFIRSLSCLRRARIGVLRLYKPGSGQVCAHPAGSTAKARPPPPGYRPAASAALSGTSPLKSASTS